MHPFDAAASEFDRYRAFPEGVPQAIHRAVWSAASHLHAVRTLDLGAGTGRIGKVFVAAGDDYIGVDLSAAMLQEFRAHMPNAILVQADGHRLPFRSHTFNIVMLMQVLSGASDWRGLLDEARRVLKPGGFIVAGHTTMPHNGVDRRMKRRLNEILSYLGAESRQGRLRRDEALHWLETQARHHSRQVAASWNAERTPAHFLERHRTGAQFSALPREIQTAALDELIAWAATEFRSLDTVFDEQHSFELDIFEF